MLARREHCLVGIRKPKQGQGSRATPCNALLDLGLFADGLVHPNAIYYSSLMPTPRSLTPPESSRTQSLVHSF